jgi:putative membrane protein
MKTVLVRTTVVLMFVALGFMQVYAHHGTQFLTTAIEANAAEVKLGQLAETKAQSQAVKDFAKMIVMDHTMSLDKMQGLLNERTKSLNTTAAIKNWHEAKLTSEHQKAIDRLSKASSANFDREFMTAIVNEHRKAIRDFEAHVRSHGNASSTQQNSVQKPGTADKVKADYALDTDTIAFASNTLPTRRKHLQRADDIQTELKAGTPVSSR